MNSTLWNETFYSDGCFGNLFPLINEHFLYIVIWFASFVGIQMAIIFFICMYLFQIHVQQNSDKKILENEGVNEDMKWEFSLGMEMTETTKMIRRRENRGD